MKDQKSREFYYFKIPVFLADLCIHFIILYAVLVCLPLNEFSYVKELLGTNHHLSYGLYTLLFLSFSGSIGLFGLRLHERRISVASVILRAIKQTCVTYILFTVVVAMVYKNVPRTMLMCEFLLSLPAIVLCHYFSNLSVRLLRKLGHNVHNVVFVGADVTNMRVLKEIKQGYAFYGYNIWGIFVSDKDEQVSEDVKVLGTINDVNQWLEEHGAPDELYCSLSPDANHDIVYKIIQLCNERFIDFYFVPSFDGYPKRHMQVNRLGNVNIIKLREEPMNSVMAKFEKRSLDIIISSLFLFTVYPLVVIFVWLGNKITGNNGPLYFKQARTGYNGKTFLIYKFRSMKVNDDADKVQATKDDPRKTPFGDFLRRSSIDELPQFINVLKGDMSIIGPRPHMEYHTEVYSSLVKNYMVRHLAKPGITGWAQINGCRGETKTVEEMANRVEHDIWYIEHWSEALDVEIFFKTIWQVLPAHDKQAY